MPQGNVEKNANHKIRCDIIYPDKMQRRSTKNLSTITSKKSVTSNSIGGNVQWIRDELLTHGDSGDGRVHIIWDEKSVFNWTSCYQYYDSEEKGASTPQLLPPSTSDILRLTQTVTTSCSQPATPPQLATHEEHSDNFADIEDEEIQSRPKQFRRSGLADNATAPQAEFVALGTSPTLKAEEFQEQLDRLLSGRSGKRLAEPITPLALTPPPKQPTLTIKAIPRTPCAWHTFVESGTRMEYYSRSKNCWLPAIVDVLKIDGQNQPLLMYCANVRGHRINDVPFHLLRRPFEDGDLVEAYIQGGSPGRASVGSFEIDNWRWVLGEISGSRARGSSVAGYPVRLTEGMLHSEEEELVVLPADRIRRRFLEGQKVFAYKDVEEGWVDAVVCGPSVETGETVPADPTAGEDMIAEEGVEDISSNPNVIRSLEKAGFTDRTIVDVSNADVPDLLDWYKNPRRRKKRLVPRLSVTPDDGGDPVIEPWVLVPVRYATSGSVEMVPSFLICKEVTAFV